MFRCLGIMAFRVSGFVQGAVGLVFGVYPRILWVRMMEVRRLTKVYRVYRV